LIQLDFVTAKAQSTDLAVWSKDAALDPAALHEVG